MASTDIRGLLELVDTDAQRALDQARHMHAAYASNFSPAADKVRQYCEVVIALCSLQLTGPSMGIAKTFTIAAQRATDSDNTRLALLAGWYAACCQMMFWTSHPMPVPDNIWDYMCIQFSSLDAQARQMHDHVRVLLARVLLWDSWLRKTSATPLPHPVDSTGALMTRAGGADPCDPRVPECIRLLESLHTHQRAPENPADYLIFTYVKGELIPTLR